MPSGRNGLPALLSSHVEVQTAVLLPSCMQGLTQIEESFPFHHGEEKKGHVSGRLGVFFCHRWDVHPLFGILVLAEW